ncbi:uncharacterized protein LOC129001380 [Macrosteles quadrilineatus]|uniref:uncharacterized protein LOC129001335 n=1 Tax=Macrosteles quadrilineatus TaxID=74068 RepID=UPI0023E147FC|nr:uncharacterized protein LOC129001335 [Macrosteles quadrilineatus]XP_054284606.1 uncharacterized protein LOC129001380 [Macrosteles quadrilineatus]
MNLKTVILCVLVLPLANQAKPWKRSTGSLDKLMKKILSQEQPYTEDELRSEISSWIMDYLDFYIKALTEMDSVKDIQNDMIRLYDLMVYNWMFYLKPEITDDVRDFLPKSFENLQTAQDVVNRLKTDIKHYSEETITKALVRYQYSSIGLSGHELLKQELTNELTSTWEKLKENWNNRRRTGTPEEKLKYSMLMRKVNKENDPVMVVHESDIVMCAQTIFLLFHQEVTDPNYEWAPMEVEIDGIKIKPYSKLKKETLFSGTWESFAKIKITDKKINERLMAYYTGIKKELEKEVIKKELKKEVIKK